MTPKREMKNLQVVDFNDLEIFFVSTLGLEPARRETLDPKSSASTNSATGAFFRNAGAKIRIIIDNY